MGWAVRCGEEEGGFNVGVHIGGGILFKARASDRDLLQINSYRSLPSSLGSRYFVDTSGRRQNGTVRARRDQLSERDRR